MTTQVDSVPMDALAPIIRDWATRNGYIIDQHAIGSGDHNAAGGIDTLSMRSGVSQRRIGAILSGTYTNRKNRKGGDVFYTYSHVSFDTADRLLCAMDRVEAWHFELEEWYGPIRIAGHEKGFEQPVVSLVSGETEGVAA